MTNVLKKIILVFLFASSIIFFYTYVWDYNISPHNNIHYIEISKKDTSEASLLNVFKKTFNAVPDFVLGFHVKYLLKFRSKKIVPGRYNIQGYSRLRHVFQHIFSGNQELIRLYINSQIQHPENFNSYVSKKTNCRYSYKKPKFYDAKTHYFFNGIDSANIFFRLMPGTYTLSWASDCQEIDLLIDNLYADFWNQIRCSKARDMGFTPHEITVIASIVQCESKIASEQRKIAGVYINRLRSNMPLQADPTLVFANRLSGVKRLNDRDKKIKSNYNTYIYMGLPPGPIVLTGSLAIESVLNAENHSFLFFCAKPERNGYSNFSSTYNEHLKHAKNYQTALNKQKIFR